MRKITILFFLCGFCGLLAGELNVYCGAGIRSPLEEIAVAYEKETGTKIKYNFGGSAQMLAQIELSKQGDVFIPGEELYVDIAKKKGLVLGDVAVLAYWMPVILVRKDNPKKIRALSDLALEGMKLGVGDERICAIGIVTKKILEKNKLLEAVEKNVIVKTTTANDLGNAIKLKTVDDVIIWDSIAYMYKDTAEIIDIPKKENETSQIVAAVIQSSRNRKKCEK